MWQSHADYFASVKNHVYAICTESSLKQNYMVHGREPIYQSFDHCLVNCQKEVWQQWYKIYSIAFCEIILTKYFRKRRSKKTLDPQKCKSHTTAAASPLLLSAIHRNATYIQTETKRRSIVRNHLIHVVFTDPGLGNTRTKVLSVTRSVK